ncbi:GNAT family N-acetyltransferase [Streptomyces milbemycinicus]|uniref:GNAT family N-acetyltransferase n=1 Tax=Streptomyces milbemycinicus TaxID=476552 RepID=UPI0034079647
MSGRQIAEIPSRRDLTRECAPVTAGTLDRDNCRGPSDGKRQWTQRGHGLCAVELRGTGQVIGRRGLNWWEQFAETEIGWTLARAHSGHGNATAIPWKRPKQSSHGPSARCGSNRSPP